MRLSIVALLIEQQQQQRSGHDVNIMADSYEDIRRQKREEFRKKKEEREQRQKEEKRKREAAAAAAAATSKSNLLSTKEGHDPFVRLHGKYGFTWERPSGNDKPTHDKDVPTCCCC